jgi:AraC family L-rhamnose operon regulatory protein RhaS
LLLLLEWLLHRLVPLDHTLTSTQRTGELFWQDMRGDPEQLAGEWTVARMAERCGLGVTRFVHHCRQLTNMTPCQYLNHCRLEAAARYLRDNASASVTQVAGRFGFSSSQYFATLFRRHFGCSPREYRQSFRGRE